MKGPEKGTALSKGPERPLRVTSNTEILFSNKAPFLTPVTYPQKSVSSVEQGQGPEHALLGASQPDSQQAGPEYSEEIREHTWRQREHLDKIQKRPKCQMGTQRHRLECSKLDFGGLHLPFPDFVPLVPSSTQNSTPSSSFFLQEMSDGWLNSSKRILHFKGGQE